MSPYQQDVIDTTLAEFDRQTAKGLPSLAAQAVAAGAFGGGREGVQRAEFQATSDRIEQHYKHNYYKRFWSSTKFSKQILEEIYN